MSTAIAAGMTAEELLALPENGTDRELMRGELKEKPMTVLGIGFTFRPSPRSRIFSFNGSNVRRPTTASSPAAKSAASCVAIRIPWSGSTWHISRPS